MDDISRIGVHDSIRDFTPDAVKNSLNNVTPTIDTVGDEHDELRLCDAIITLEHRDTFLHSSIRWIHAVSAGTDRFPVETYANNGIILTNSSGVHSDIMAENVIGLMISLAHQLHTYRDLQQKREWKPDIAWEQKYSLRGQTLCVIGLGNIGTQIAHVASKLGMHVIGVRRSPGPVEYVETVYSPDHLHIPISQSDVIVLSVPLTEQTRHLIGEPELNEMKKDALLVNVSRGPVINQQELIEALDTYRIGGAALDVFKTEPLPQSSPLWGFDNVIITPHISGGFSGYVDVLGDLIQENIDLINKGQDPKNRIC